MGRERKGRLIVPALALAEHIDEVTLPTRPSYAKWTTLQTGRPLNLICTSEQLPVKPCPDGGAESLFATWTPVCLFTDRFPSRISFLSCTLTPVDIYLSIYLPIYIYIYISFWRIDTRLKRQIFSILFSFFLFTRRKIHDRVSRFYATNFIRRRHQSWTFDPSGLDRIFLCAGWTLCSFPPPPPTRWIRSFYLWKLFLGGSAVDFSFRHSNFGWCR